MKKKTDLTDAQWRQKLTPECYAVCRGKGTEQPFANAYWDCHDRGVYHCAACGQPLFRSEDKYDSGTGWPSFTKPITEERVEHIPDGSHGMIRTEVVCSTCSSHLGHLFDDGPPPTGKRYCLNSTALKLERS